MRPFPALMLLAAGALVAPWASADAPGEHRPLPARTSWIKATSMPSPAGGLTLEERAALLSGDVVSRPLSFDRPGGGRYVGGVSYQVIRAVPDEVLSAMLDVSALPELLPRTKRASLIESSGSGTRIELVQGNAVAEATYTLLLSRSAAGEVRFWLDPTRAHDIRDVWGFFRARPFGNGKTLVTVAVALDVGPGLVRMLFEDRIQRLVLETPRHIRDYVEPRALALR
jgi:hypothetical protein